MTKDIDLAGADDEQTATTRLIAAQAINLHDHFGFDVARTAALDQAEAFRAVRYSVTAEVAGRRFEQFPVDVALNDRPRACLQDRTPTQLMARWKPHPISS